ncbi:MFS transporter, DHA2 family, multidrug resistance protein [Novosphingobium sp. CF614]|uniref:DHA2 family efflux MFS transporter permease subunit n=1 Tax=Novosphingobium sp. CF614 TaxID=1884364 RepID=UPI0008E476E0|nr:DHA2 family efflux MFS transporter permease subunit [Novosphingobium sp. CF614]SFG25657.1 MFS transporter, DHA2 family, multidrug resistance protein [Novosphingobium sp. CF614]
MADTTAPTVPASRPSPSPSPNDAAGGSSTTLTGARLVVAGFVLAMANFIVVLDLTIANVSVPHIAGALAVSTQSGTWVITSYAVAEAICVPLTGWLVGRFGALRTFLFSLAGFGLFSALCGLSSTLGMLVVFRLGQGFCGGPLMPLTQTLMLRIFPRHMHSRAMAMWAMTLVTAPILGPILGGTISDNWSWEWIFFINVPIAIGIFAAAIVLLRRIETPTVRLPIDVVGLVLLVIWVGALQMMLDLGREEDWFASTRIVLLAVTAAIFFCVFLIWELTEEHPIVDLKVFRHRGYTATTVALMIAFGTYFASVVVVPQFLQISMGYTATDAGYVMAFSGVLALVASPFVPRLMQRFDPRLLVFVGISWVGVCAIMRTWWTSDSVFWQFAYPQLLQGAGVSLFIVPLTTISLAAVRPEETASAAGLANFGRTLAAAAATAIVTTVWSNMARSDGAELAGSLNGAQAASSALQAGGFSAQQARGAIAEMVGLQAVTNATTHLFALSAVALFLAATAIWLAPRPPRDIKLAAGH